MKKIIAVLSVVALLALPMTPAVSLADEEGLLGLGAHQETMENVGNLTVVPLLLGVVNKDLGKGLATLVGAVPVGGVLLVTGLLSGIGGFLGGLAHGGG